MKLPRHDTRPLALNETAETAKPSQHVWRKCAAPLRGAEEQTARAISAYVQCACLLHLQIGSINRNGLDPAILDFFTLGFRFNKF